jgi:hypothetical protein
LGESTKVEIASDGTSVRFALVPNRVLGLLRAAVRPRRSRPFTRAKCADDEKPGMIGPAPLPRPVKLTLALALLLTALAALLCRPAPSSAGSAAGACASAHAKQHVRACAGRHRAGHARGKAKGRHSGRHHPINKKKKATQHGSVDASSTPAEPATCEDGSTPQSEGDASFSCADGSEPVCAGGGEPVPSKNDTKLVCPTAAGTGTEWSEAECEDGGAPERSADGTYACEDGSSPACADGSRPTPSDDGSMLVCLAQGTPAPSSPAPSSAAEEDAEDESEG